MSKDAQIHDASNALLSGAQKCLVFPLSHFEVIVPYGTILAGPVQKELRRIPENFKNVNEIFTLQLKFKDKN